MLLALSLLPCASHGFFCAPVASVIDGTALIDIPSMSFDVVPAKLDASVQDSFFVDPGNRHDVTIVFLYIKSMLFHRMAALLGCLYLEFSACLSFQNSHDVIVIRRENEHISWFYVIFRDCVADRVDRSHCFSNRRVDQRMLEFALNRQNAPVTFDPSCPTSCLCFGTERGIAEDRDIHTLSSRLDFIFSVV